MNINVTTCVPEEIYREVKESRWKWNELILMGIQAKKNFPSVLERQNELETNNQVLAEKVQRLARRLYDLEIENKESDKN